MDEVDIVAIRTKWGQRLMLLLDIFHTTGIEVGSSAAAVHGRKVKGGRGFVIVVIHDCYRGHGMLIGRGAIGVDVMGYQLLFRLWFVWVWSTSDVLVVSKIMSQK